MTTQKNTPNLYHIQEMYYFRTRIPFDLRLWFNGQEDFKRSLKTKSLKQARRLLRVWNYRTEETFTLMRSGMLTHDQIQKLADNYKHKTLADLEEDRVDGCRSVTPSDPHELDERLEMLSVHEANYRAALSTNDLKGVSRITDSLIEDNELGEVSKGEYVALARELLKKSIEIFQIEQKRMVGDYHNGYDDRIVEPVTAAPSIIAPIVSSPLLSDTIDKFMEDQHRKESANSDTLKEYASICKLFLDVVGDIPVQEISRDSLRGYLDTLKLLPPHITKRKQYSGKTIQEILTMNEGGQTISTATIEKALTVIKTLFTWMSAEGAIDKNPSDVLKAPKKEVRPDQERNAYTTQDLQKLMAGLKAEEEKGRLKDHPERYWVPLIGLFSGMRLNEICQLHTADIVEEQGVHCFKVQSDEDGTKQLKTAASYRTVPIHRTLIELGFMEYVKECVRTKQPRLWMKLNRDSRGKYNKNLSNWFLGTSHTVGFLRTYVITDDLLDFHSFRHTFVNTLKQADIAEVKISELVGHTNSSMTSGRYGKRYEIAKMKQTVDSLYYEGVEFGEVWKAVQA